MSKVISVTNQKGGVGKTTTAHALSYGLEQKGYKTLLVDLDPQENLSDVCDADSYTKPTIYEVMKGSVKAKDAVQAAHCTIIPSNIMLAGLEQELSARTGKEYCLKEALEPLMDEYDYIIIDTPPSLGILTVNALTASDEVIVPTIASKFAVSGIAQLAETVKNVKKYCNKDLVISGILFTMHNPQTNVGKLIKDATTELGETLNAPVYETFIRKAVAVEEAALSGQTVLNYAKKSTVAIDYNNFVEEFLKGEIK